MESVTKPSYTTELVTGERVGPVRCPVNIVGSVTYEENCILEYGFVTLSPNGVDKVVRLWVTYSV